MREAFDGLRYLNNKNRVSTADIDKNAEPDNPADSLHSRLITALYRKLALLWYKPTVTEVAAINRRIVILTRIFLTILIAYFTAVFPVHADCVSDCRDNYEAVTAAAADTLASAEAIHHLGVHATVCGQVVNTKYAATSLGSPTFLDLDRAYPDHIFTVVIWGMSRIRFPYQPESLAGKLICVTGTISSYRGRAQIEATDPSQIRLREK